MSGRPSIGSYDLATYKREAEQISSLSGDNEAQVQDLVDAYEAHEDIIEELDERVSELEGDLSEAEEKAASLETQLTEASKTVRELTIELGDLGRELTNG
ncbi:hypothetical protein LCGC14_1299610 [marine sediment metagenome]|uniref:Uncharacterized protein n=1 Tax=marine sediment metagenome TaxID=412755 RepID=A0A0F9N6M0_9ZZZZ